MNKRPLFLVTYEFPFWPGEYFIETEIEYLTAYFSPVFVIPYRRAWHTKQRGVRAMPSGAVLLDPGVVSIATKAIWSFIAALRAPWLMAVGFAHYRRREHLLAGVPLREWLRASYKTSLACSVLYWALSRTGTVHLTGYSYWRDEGAYAMAFLRSAGDFKHLIVRCHNIDLYDTQPVRRFFEDYLHAQADWIHPVSEDGCQYLIEKKALPKSNITLKRLGVRMPPQVAPGSSDGILRIVSCSNLNQVKRVDRIARTIGKIQRRCEWTIIGDGPEMDKVRGIVNTFTAGQKAIFLGRLANSAVLDYYMGNPVDLFINLSAAEGVPVSIMEALAAGIPVLATDVGGSAEIVLPSGGVIVAAQTSEEYIARIIEEMMGDAAKVAHLRKAARATAQQLCSAEANYTKFCEELAQ